MNIDDLAFYDLENGWTDSADGFESVIGLGEGFEAYWELETCMDD